ncbi:hypothetical protein BOTU111921_03480 [Bordetella tumbae]
MCTTCSVCPAMYGIISLNIGLMRKVHQCEGSGAARCGDVPFKSQSPAAQLISAWRTSARNRAQYASLPCPSILAKALRKFS